MDVLIYVDASLEDLEAWYIERFMTLWRAGRNDAASFYARFSGMTPDQAEMFGRQVWREINLPNVVRHVAPLRDTADIVVRKVLRPRNPGCLRSADCGKPKPARGVLFASEGVAHV